MDDELKRAVKTGIPIHFVQIGYDRWPSVCMAALITGVHTSYLIDLVSFVRDGGFFFNQRVAYDESLVGYTWHFISSAQHIGR